MPTVSLMLVGALKVSRLLDVITSVSTREQLNQIICGNFVTEQVRDRFTLGGDKVKACLP
jgi:hypothetical protein